MPIDPRKRQQALAREASKRKQKKIAQRRQAQFEREFTASARPLLRAAGAWPLHEVLLSENWTDPTQLTQVLVARRSPAGQVAAAVFLVDQGCLGVKSAFARLFHARSEYEDEIRAGLMEAAPMTSADLNLAAKIVRDAVRYAQDLGFDPDPDITDAALVVGSADPDACKVEIPLGGPQGKPLFVSGPHDNPRRIIARLTERLGPEGFHYLVGAPDMEEPDVLPPVRLSSPEDAADDED
jgi:hypothetical protein